MTLKLSRAATLRPAAEVEIDAHYASKINEVLGPLAVVHLLKRLGALVDGDANEIAMRAEEQDDALAALDKERRELKARVRAANTAVEINEILASL
jgi:hypothetical protein